jgi:uncharacterized membrane protein YphA (DoxX/SURF4 family)
MMKTLRLISRLLVGVVFIFSGFVKAVDPLGSTYKFIDYFNAFHLSSFEVLGLPLAIVLSAAELVMGISLLLGYRMKITAWLVLLFMSFFTILTFILAIFNPVTDCGCFGDALILTNWQTFYKNVVLILFVFIIFFGRDKYPALRTPVAEWSVISLFFAVSVILSIYCYRNLPILDFRPYHIGANITEGMKIPEDAPADIYETHLFYKNKETGKTEEFRIDNFPKDTLLWAFEDARSVLVSKGYEPPIHDFVLNTRQGSDITDRILSDPGYSLLLVTHKLSSSSDAGLQEAEKFFHLSQTLDDLSFYAVTASTTDEINKKITDLGLDYDFLLADEIMLKTVIRSNPGLVLLKNGTIIGKWHYNNFPAETIFGAYKEVYDDFPFCLGCRTTNIADYPAGLRAKTAFDLPFTAQILNSPALSFLFFIKNPESLSEDMYSRIITIGGMAGEYLDQPYEFFGLLPMESSEIMNFSDSHISPFEYLSIPENWLDKYLFENVWMVGINNGEVFLSLKDKNIPLPEELPEMIYSSGSLPVLSQELTKNLFIDQNTRREKSLVYAFIFGFLSLILLLRTLFKA